MKTMIKPYSQKSLNTLRIVCALLGNAAFWAYILYMPHYSLSIDDPTLSITIGALEVGIVLFLLSKFNEMFIPKHKQDQDGLSLAEKLTIVLWKVVEVGPFFYLLGLFVKAYTQITILLWEMHTLISKHLAVLLAIAFVLVLIMAIALLVGIFIELFKEEAKR